MADEYLSFSQRQGLAGLPQQMELGEISVQLRSSLWRIFLDVLTDSKVSRNYGTSRLNGPIRAVWLDWRVEYNNEFLDTETVWFEDAQNGISAILRNSSFSVLLDFLEFVYRHKLCPSELLFGIPESLVKHRSAYRIIGDIVVPIAEENEIKGVEQSLETINSAPANGAKSHMLSSAKCLRNGEWGNSIRESITAVESAARSVEPEAKSLKDALNKLRDSGKIKHKALQNALNQLYGYTSDEQGIRHALVMKEEADVNEAEAIFMFGACASFASYLLKFDEKEN